MSKKKTLEQCINDFKKVHGNTYDYSQVHYVDWKTPVSIICKMHGTFPQKPNIHLNGSGCPYCGKERRIQKRTQTTEQFIEKAIKVHNNSFDYSKTDLLNKNEKGEVCIICKKHGEFWQLPTNHLRGHGCNECKKERLREINSMPTQTFIEKSKEIHSHYKYTKTNLDNRDEEGRVIITCPKHGDFLQTPKDHLNGRGCPICKSSHLEEELRLLLLNNNIPFQEQKRFDWLGLQSLDFYIPSKNIAIECQGIQHFEPRYIFGMNEYIKTKERDKLKLKLCLEHNVGLLYYANYKYNFPYKVITNKEELIELIKSN